MVVRAHKIGIYHFDHVTHCPPKYKFLSEIAAWLNCNISIKYQVANRHGCVTVDPIVIDIKSTKQD